MGLCVGPFTIPFYPRGYLADHPYPIPALSPPLHSYSRGNAIRPGTQAHSADTG
jgi:hypothetical protein